MHVRYRMFMVIFLTSLLLGSCNVLLSSARLRENPEDEAAQITSVTVVPKESTTAYVAWSWKAPPDWLDSDDWITEIKIEQSSITYPEINIPFAGKTFSRSDNWETEWSGLSSDETHYFSLFMKDNNGQWYPPILAKVYIPGSVSDVSGKVYSRVSSVNVNESSSATYDPSSLDVKSSALAVIYMDFDKVYITNATITLSISVSVDGDIDIFALSGFLPGDDSSKWNEISDNSLVNTAVIAKSSVTTSDTSITVDITAAARAAALTPWKAIGIRSSDGSAELTIDNNTQAPFITADYVE